MSFKTIVNYTTKNDGYKNNGTLTVRGIMIHSTATPGIMAKTFRERFNKANLGKSVHGFIDDQFYVQCLPYNKKAGHCRYSGNNTHIGIEMCEPKNWKTDRAYFEKVYENTVQLTADLCKQFHLTEKDVLSHAEGYKKGIASNHSDVGHWFPYFDKDMDDFRADVRKILEGDVVERTTKKELIKDLQASLNAAYNEALDVDGLIGPKTEAAIKRHLLKYKKGKTLAKGKYVKWVQTRLITKGYGCGVDGADGYYGEKSAIAAKAFQKNQKLTVDGVVGYKTVTALLD